MHVLKCLLCICVCLWETGQRYVALQMLEEAESEGSVCIYAADAFFYWESAQGSQAGCILVVQPALSVHAIYICTTHDLKSILKHCRKRCLTHVPDECYLHRDDPAPIHKT